MIGGFYTRERAETELPVSGYRWAFYGAGIWDRPSAPGPRLHLIAVCSDGAIDAACGFELDACRILKTRAQAMLCPLCEAFAKGPDHGKKTG